MAQFNKITFILKINLVNANIEALIYSKDIIHFLMDKTALYIVIAGYVFFSRI